MKTGRQVETIEATCPVCRASVSVPAGAIDDEGNYSLDCPKCSVPVSGKIKTAPGEHRA